MEDKILSFQFKTVSTKPPCQCHKFQKLRHVVYIKGKARLSWNTAVLTGSNYLTGFSQFLSFFKHVRNVSRTHSSIKMEPIAKIVNGSRGVFRTKWKI